MKKGLTILFCIGNLTISCGQTSQKEVSSKTNVTTQLNIRGVDINVLIDSLKYIKDMPYICETGTGPGCGDQIFWEVVKHKENAIPLLLDRLADTTSAAASVANLGGQWTVADIAYTALEEIIKGIPTFELLGVKFDEHGCGYCSYWNHLRKDIENRRKFQTAVKNWYISNKENLVWIASEEFQSCDCNGKHPNGGHFELKK